MEKRTKFVSKELDMERVEEQLQHLVSHCSLNECLKIIREIANDMVCYYSENNKGIIYDGTYTQEQIEQATFLQRKLRDVCDLFAQVVIDKREFNDEYLRKRLGY